MDLDRDLVAAALPGYSIGDEIGRGGWGAVLRARHNALGRDVAIKQLPRDFASDHSALDRFMSEARIIGALDHPHIVKVYDFVEFQGTWLIVMELLSGGTLWEYYTRYGIRADQACGITLAMCSALDAAHSRGILHRDIKPENILFSSDGVARLGDFGIAKEVGGDQRRTRAGEVIGTPTYMSPEQALGAELGPPSDIYSLGIVLYEQLAGRVPFPEAKTPGESLIQHVTETPAPLSETAPAIPPAIAQTVMAALTKEPAARFPDAESFGVALAHSCVDSYGATWLHDSGTKLMGGGPIAAAAMSAPRVVTPPRPPTMSMPAARADHFSGGTAMNPTPAPLTPAPTPSAPLTPGPLTPGPDAPGPLTPGPLTPGPVPAESVPSVRSAYAAQTAAPAGPGTATSPPKRGRGRLVAAVVVFLLLVAAAATAIAVTRPRPGRDTAAPKADQGQATTTKPDATTGNGSTKGGGDVTTTKPSGATTTTAPTRECRDGQRCVFIDSVKAQGDSYVIAWTAMGFDPSFKEGFFHAHFFWDIYSPDQAGTNASTFGVTQGAWEITDQQPFVSKGEVTVANKPAAANRICVTVGNFAHAVADPHQFDCAPIPTS